MSRYAIIVVAVALGVFAAAAFLSWLTGSVAKGIVATLTLLVFPFTHWRLNRR